MRKIEEIKMKRMQKDKKPVVKSVKSVKKVECLAKKEALTVDKKCDKVETEAVFHAEFVDMNENDITVDTSNVPVMETTLNFESHTPMETAYTLKPKKRVKKKKVVDEPNDWNV